MEMCYARLPADIAAPQVTWALRRATALLMAFLPCLFPAVSAGGEAGKADQPARHADHARPTQYILLNRAPGQGMYQGQPDTLGQTRFTEVLSALPNRPDARIQTGLSYVFSCFRTPPETTVAALRTFLQAAEATHTPVLVQIDTEHWWDARPDLWNWWDPQRPGFDPANRENVEWTDWSPDSALKIAWRNWGRQIRVLPPPNLASPRYLAACHAEIRRLVPIILDWHAQLPAEKKHLLVGIKLGHETSIGVNAYHYPRGNELLAQPASADPSRVLNTDDVLARGVAQIGFAALKTAGIRSQGTPTESELRDVARQYLQSLCQVAAEAGVPRHLLFAHGAGWKSGELSYDIPVNAYACPGWSFYAQAADPRHDVGVQRNLAQSDAPYWAATEWLLQGPFETPAWRKAIENTLADPRCRYMCIFNWESISQQPAVLQAITETVVASVPAVAPSPARATALESPSSPPTKVDTGRFLIGASLCPIWRGEQCWQPLRDFPDRKPLMGWYDEGTPEVTDWEIKWALEHGISFFMVCWYRASGNEGKPVVPALSHWLHEGLPRSRFGDQFRFAINFENNHPLFGGRVSEADLFEHLLPYWIDNYFQRSNYLIVDGRPLLAIYNVKRFIDDLGGEAAATAAIARMQTVCRDAGWKGLYLLGQCCWGSPAELQRQAEQIVRVGMDACWAYHLPTFTGAFADRPRPTGNEAIAAQEQLWDRWPEPNILSLSVGWDSQPWRSSLSPVQWRLNGDELRQLCESAKTRLERRAPESLAGRVVLLDGWNEFGEGHFISPTVGHRFDHLDAVRQVFARHVQSHEDAVPDLGGADR